MSPVGRYFVLDGPDGCGKTTQTHQLAHWLGEECGREVLHVREPGSRHEPRRHTSSRCSTHRSMTAIRTSSRQAVVVTFFIALASLPNSAWAHLQEGSASEGDAY